MEYNDKPWGMLIIIGMIALLLAVQTAYGASPRIEGAASKEVSKIERLITSVEATLQSLRSWLEDIKEKWCSNGVESMCPVPEVSMGHTVLVRIGNVKATMYNNEKRQTDDSPCHSNGKDICAAFDEGKNPIAISGDMYGYPLNLGDKVKLESLEEQPECKAYDGKVMTVMDSLSDCLSKYKDPRTGRCHPDHLIENQ